MNARFIPMLLKDFPSPREASERRRSQFKAGWGKTIQKLDYELSRIGAYDVVIQAGYSPTQIRMDGWPYGKATPGHPAVVISFRDAKGESLSFPCDTFSTIDDNLRAIALSLEALRAVDRFGVTRRNEQYMGFKAIEAPRSMTVEEAAAFVGNWARDVDVLASREDYRRAMRTAAITLHPDFGGDVQLWHKLTEAREILEAHFGKERTA